MGCNQRYSTTDSVNDGDRALVFSIKNGDWREAPLSLLKSFFQSGVTAADDKFSQYAAPSATGFSVQINDASDSVWLILTPVAGYANGEIVLPALANCVDKQEVLVNCTQAITALVVDGNGATVTGEPAAMAANDFFRLRFDGVANVWYRVG